MKIIPIFFSFDNNYCAQAAVTFQSLLINRRSDIHYKMYVLHKSISEGNIQKLTKLVSEHTNADLTFINVSDIIQIEFDDRWVKGHIGAKFTEDGLFRCFATEIEEFKRYNKIIYSDVDIVVVDDISELYSIPIDDVYLAGFHTPEFLKHEITHLDKKYMDSYFGGGLYVLNLDKMRADNIGEKIKDIITNPPYKLIWNEQDVMNLACGDKVTYFSYRYVSIPDWLPILEKKNFYDVNYPNGELYDAMYRPKIVHYAGKKPWNSTGRGYPLKSDLWYYWLSKTTYFNDFKSRRDGFKNYQKKYKTKLFGLINISSIIRVSSFEKHIYIKLFNCITLLKLKSID